MLNGPNWRLVLVAQDTKYELLVGGDDHGLLDGRELGPVLKTASYGEEDLASSTPHLMLQP